MPQTILVYDEHCVRVGHRARNLEQDWEETGRVPSDAVTILATPENSRWHREMAKQAGAGTDLWHLRVAAAIDTTLHDYAS